MQLKLKRGWKRHLAASAMPDLGPMEVRKPNSPGPKLALYLNNPLPFLQVQRPSHAVTMAVFNV